MDETPTDIPTASAVHPDGPGRFHWQVPAEWEQGRGAYGGIILAAMTRAMLQNEAPDRLARALSASLATPVTPGSALITVERLREGNAVTTWSCRLLQSDEVKAQATLTVGRHRPTGHLIPPSTTQAQPISPPWSEVPVTAGVKPPFAPVFTRHFELRALPPMPFSAAATPTALAWVRARRHDHPIGAPELVALSDVCWPGALALERTPRPMATIAYHCSFGWPPHPIEPGLPLLHRGTVVAGADGYFTEIRELFTADGHLVCHNPQVFAWIK